MDGKSMIEIMESQNQLLAGMRTRLFEISIREETISRRQALNALKDVDEFLADFVAINERSINLQKGTTNGEQASEEGPQQPVSGSTEISNATPGPA